MSAHCCSAPGEDANSLNNPRWRRVLWIALILNAAMFAVEIVIGSAAESRALQADALDFFGDATNYAISLLVAGMALTWRSRAALFKGVTLLLFSFWVMGSTVYSALTGSSPEPQSMGLIGILALLVNVGVASLLFRYRIGDANMRSVWICSRNDAIGNIAVIGAAIGVFGTGTAWPDLLVAAILGILGLSGGVQIIAQATKELIGPAHKQANSEHSLNA